MKKILILYPHFPPSNLAGVHRPRLFAQHLESFGWKPTILTVHEDYYEELPDWNLVKLLPEGLRVEKVKAFPLTKPRLIGDIGLRSMVQLYRRAKQLIKQEGFQFLYIPVPSFYVALLGRMLHNSTGILYGIDYIDPWVHHFPGSQKLFSRHWFSTQMASLLEPWAIKKASLITGVAEGYYTSVLQRNPLLKDKVIAGAMPYGGEALDHIILSQFQIKPYLFHKNGKFQFIYAGAMLPKAYALLEAILKGISMAGNAFSSVEFHFIGTGKTAGDPVGYTIRPLAEQYGLWQTVIFEYPKRIPYADVLVHLGQADAVFILGSTEPHYTPSKTYQAVLAKKQIMAVLHASSTAVEVIRKSNAGLVLAFNGEQDVAKIANEFAAFVQGFLAQAAQFDGNSVQQDVFEQYSAKAVTAALASLLDEAYARKK